MSNGDLKFSFILLVIFSIITLMVGWAIYGLIYTLINYPIIFVFIGLAIFCILSHNEDDDFFGGEEWLN